MKSPCQKPYKQRSSEDLFPPLYLPIAPKATALLPPSLEPSTRMKRLHLREEGLCANPAPKKHKIQTKNECSDNAEQNLCYGSGVCEYESEYSEAMEEDELDSDVEFPEVETAEEELERLQKEWNAPIYGFFQKKPIISVVNGRRCHEFICSAPICLGRGQCPRRVRRYLDKQDAKSTGNLHKHAVICWGEEAVKRARSGSAKGVPKLLSDAKENVTDGTFSMAIDWVGAGGARKSTYSDRPDSKVAIRLEAIRWVSQSKHPFNIVQDHGFLRLMKTGRPHMWIPSPMTIARDVHKVFVSCQQRIAAILQKYPGRLSFAISTWTSPNNVPYMAVSVHLQEGGKPVSLFLDFTEISKSHNGLNLAFEFVQILKSFGIENKLLAITCDSASNKDIMVAETREWIKEFPGKRAQVYCLAHIINLIVKSILSQFDNRMPRQGVNGVEVVDTESDNIEGWIEEPTGAEAKMKIEPVRLMLFKLRKAACSIKKSTSLRLRWNNRLSEQGLPVRMMPCDLATRWHSTYDMLRFATKYKPALAVLLRDEVELNDFQLSNTEWNLAEELCDVLKVFKDASIYASRNTTSVAAVIPTMDRIYSLFSAQSTTCRFSDIIITALIPGMKTLERYHSKACVSQTYRIATILNPRHKLRYFKQTGRDERWIEESRAMLEDQWEMAYAQIPLPTESTSVQVAKTSRTALSVQKQQNGNRNMFDFDLFTSALVSETANCDELKHYLSTDIEQVTDPIEWWNGKAHIFPRLSRMAFDYLTIPATSIEVERIFSEGRSLLSHTRSRLTPKSTRALMCLGEWSMSGFIQESDMLRILMMEDNFKDEDGIECEYGDEDLDALFCD